MSDLKTIRVVAAVIRGTRDNKEKIFATARGYGDYKGLRQASLTA